MNILRSCNVLVPSHIIIYIMSVIRILKSQVKKYYHYKKSILPLKQELFDDLDNKRNNIIEELSKNDLENINKYLWGGVKNRFNMDWFALYKSLGHEYNLWQYVPDDFYYIYVDAFFANRKACVILDDKNLYDLLFHDVSQPRTLARRVGDVYLAPDYSQIDFESFIGLCTLEKKVVLKQSINSNGGKGIIFFDVETDSVDNLRDWVKSKNNIVVQGVLKQHTELAKLHPQSINTIRIITLFFNSEVHVLSSVLRMGVGGAKVDNASSGGIVCGIEPSGRLKPEAFDVKANRYDRHPSGVRFESVSVPSFNSCLELCKKMALRLVQFTKLVSWDIAIDEQGAPVLLEANLSRGQVDFHQMCNGPIFGVLSQNVLEYVFRNNGMLTNDRF